jgi:hypothetical protein
MGKPPPAHPAPMRAAAAGTVFGTDVRHLSPSLTRPFFPM